jgi:VanZ family protein
VRRFAPPIVWAAVLCVASSVPGDALPSAGAPHADKLAHAVAYALLAWLLARSARAEAAGVLALCAGAAAAYGVLDEVHQAFTPGRDANGWDVAADAAGAAVGVCLRCWRARRGRTRQARRPTQSSAQTRANP